MRSFLISFLTLLFSLTVTAQNPRSVSSADILQELKKLEVFGSVLYIAAHPDDENTRLLSYLANEKLYRTVYLSITRGDGGQNLIGDEQGIDLGLIRTQELLAARRIDGAEQYFTRAYDFGYSKSPEEALRIWDHDKVLADVVWVIRSFKPDVIITRFPTTGEGGHGHHTASAILASEAFDAAADPKQFTEQFKNGVSTWQAKRLLWNSFNFGGNNATRPDQFKLDVGGYNPVIGKSYGEMSAESRSNHKSQGFGVAAQRGTNFEYFATIKGEKPMNDLFDGVDISASRLNFGAESKKSVYTETVKKLISQFDPSNPANSIKDLQTIYDLIIKAGLPTEDYFKQPEINKLILDAGGIYMEATAVSQLNTIGDSARFNIVFNNRSGVPIEKASVIIFQKTYEFNNFEKNTNNIITATILIPEKEMRAKISEFENRTDNDYYTTAEHYPHHALFQIVINGLWHNHYIPILYKSTDPVKGEVYQPIQLTDPVSVSASPSLLIFSNHIKNERKEIQYTIQANKEMNEKVIFKNIFNGSSSVIFDSVVSWPKGEKRTFKFEVNGGELKNNTGLKMNGELNAPSLTMKQVNALNKISYDHIPDIFYHYIDHAKVIKLDLRTEGSRAGYIAGAGDKVPEALEQMGYTVTMLNENNINITDLDQLDVIITGIRAYNIHTWLSNAYSKLMQYVKNGGVLLTQYNTNNTIGPVKAKISPYPFNISRNRITDETAIVKFLIPQHPALNYPNKITSADFEGWIQERSIYHAENTDNNFQKILAMSDPGEKEHDGSLIIAPYGKGKFIYTGIVFFRELPAGVPGAYRLFANLIANKRK